jgi:thiol-disulfide isomerase/thioredoxin
VVVLNFWAEWCPPCMQELPVLAKLVEDAGPEVVFVPAYDDTRPPPSSRFHVWLANQPTYFRDRVCFADFSVRAGHDLERLPLTVIYGRDGSVVETFVGSIERRTKQFNAAISKALKTSAPPLRGK